MIIQDKIQDSSLNEESLTKIGKDIIKYFPSKAMGMLGNLLLVPIYTNLLVPEQYGLYNIAISVLSFLCIIFSDWVGRSGLRFFSEHDKVDDVKSYFSTLLFLLVSNLGIMYLFAFLMFRFMSSFFKIPPDFLYLVILLIIPVAIRALLFQVLRAQIKPLSYTFSVILNQILTIGLAIYFITQWHLEASSIILAMAISISIIDFVMMYQSKMMRSLELQKIKFNVLTKFYHYGLPIAASSLGIWLITQSNRFILQYYQGSYSNGLLAVGFQLTFSLILPLAAVITIASIPRIINQYELGHDVNPIITKLTGYYFLIFTPIVVILSIYAKDIVILISNKNYSDSYILIPFLAISVFAFGLTEYTAVQYHLAKKTYIDTFVRLTPGILGILLNIILIPKFGLLAVGISTLVSNVLYFILTLVIKIKDLSWIPPYETINKCAIALLTSLTFIFISKTYLFVHTSVHLIFQILIFAGVYLTTLKLQYKYR